MVPSSRRRFCRDLVIIGMFLAVIGSPLLGRVLVLEGAFALSENRRPAPLPQLALNGWSIVSFPRRFERYWNDHFAFRRVLIRWHSVAKLHLGVSPSSKAIIGQDGYLFYAAEQSVDYHRAVKPFTPRDLSRWQRDLEARRAWLADRGIRYLVVVVPSKETIYPEHMPEALRPARSVTRLDQLLEHLRTSPLDVLDLRPALRRAKREARVYHKTDTHWNDLGAFVAYGEILTRLQAWFPGMVGQPLEARTLVHVTRGGDLARMLAVEDRFPEEQITLVPRTPRRAVAVAGTAPNGAPLDDIVVMECPSCEGPHAVMLADSFNTNLAPFLVDHFARIVFFPGSKLDRALIEREQPGVVIQEFVERVLMCDDLSSC